MVNCCNLVGNFDISAKGIISITSRGGISSDVVSYADMNAVLSLPSKGTVSISAYASETVYYGCQGRAGVSVSWVEKNNCDEYTYIYSGPGKSFMSGGVASYVYFPKIKGINNPISEYKVINASAASSPAALYEDSIQMDGFGLVYDADPWRIDTSTENGCIVNLTSYGIGGYGECKLQSLNIQFIPGKLPVVNMDFIYSIGG